MGFMDKLKNIFFEEEEEEEIEERVESKPEKDVVVKKIEVPKRKKEENIEIKPKEELTKEEINYVEIKKEQPKPVTELIFDDDDFVLETPKVKKEEIYTKKVETTNVYKSRENRDLYKKEEPLTKKETPKYEYTKTITETKETKTFTPSPIISPIYGILDKNYKKEEPKVKDETNYEIPRDTRRSLTFEDVRKKAYGTLADDIKDNMLCDDCEVLKTVNEIKKENEELKENLLSEFYEERRKSDASMSLEDAEDNYYDFGVSYEHPAVNEVVPKKVQATTTIENTTKMKIVSFDEIEPSAEKIEMKEIKKEIPREDNLELTDDLFNLIDSMYEERKD